MWKSTCSNTKSMLIWSCFLEDKSRQKVPVQECTCKEMFICKTERFMKLFCQVPAHSTDLVKTEPCLRYSRALTTRIDVYHSLRERCSSWLINDGPIVLGDHIQIDESLFQAYSIPYFFAPVSSLSELLIFGIVYLVLCHFIHWKNI